MFVFVKAFVVTLGCSCHLKYISYKTVHLFVIYFQIWASFKKVWTLLLQILKRVPWTKQTNMIPKIESVWTLPVSVPSLFKCCLTECTPTSLPSQIKTPNAHRGAS